MQNVLQPAEPAVSEEQNSKIDAGVIACLETCKDPYHRFSNMVAFVNRLESDPTWTADELTELEWRVLKTCGVDREMPNSSAPVQSRPSREP